MSSLMAKWLQAMPRKSVAFIYGDRSITWGELNDRVNRLANALWDLGMRKNDKVTLMFHNCPQFAEACYAVQKIGAIPVPMNYRFVAREIEYQTNHSDSVAYVFEDLWLDAVLSARANLEKVKHYICYRRSGKEIPKDMLDYEELIAKYPAGEPTQVDVGWDDTSHIVYTGGTTGWPKGVVVTWDNVRGGIVELGGGFPLLLPNIKLPQRRLSVLIENPIAKRILSNTTVQKLITGSLKLLLNRLVTGYRHRRLLGRVAAAFGFKTIAPGFQVFHEAYFLNLMFPPLTGVPSTLLMPEMVHFDAAKVMEMVDRYKPASMWNTPTAWKKLIEHLEGTEPDRYNKSSIKMAMTGAAYTSATLKKRILRQFPQAMLMDSFGQTEALGTTLRIDTVRTEVKDRSVGTALVETRILGENGNEIKKPGEVGEIVYRGRTVMKEYYKDSAKTAEATRNGWFHSGDLGYCDEDGEIRVVERISECIITGGLKVYPIEVEEILEEFHKVEHVCVIGVPDELWGKAVRAVIELKPGETASEEEIIDWCRDKMSSYKRPKTVVFAESLPLNPVGKVLRRKVEEKYGK